MRKGTYSGTILIGSIIAGVIYAILGEILYRSLQSVLLGVILIPIYFVGLFLFLGGAIGGLAKLVYSRFYSPIDFKQWIRVFLLMVVCSIAFEFLYELQFGEEKESSNSYIFVLDNSGSMEENDPQGMRFEAVENLLSEKAEDFKYAVYTFSDSAECIRGMNSKSVGTTYNYGINEGGTAILATLQTLLSDIEEDKLILEDNKTHIILLSDGYATDINFFNKYKCISYYFF